MIGNNKLFYDSMVKKHYEFIMSHGKKAFDSVAKYTSTGINKRINRAIRKQKVLKEEDRKIVNDLDKLYNEVEPTTQPLTLYRGIKNKDHINTDGTFISASYVIDVGNKFIDRPKKCCLIIFNIPIGSKVLFIGNCSYYFDEYEVLLDRKAEFSVTSIKEDDKGFTQIYVTYIPKGSLPVPANIKDIMQIGKLSPSKLSLSQLKLKAKMMGCNGYSNMNKAQLVSFVRTCKKSPPRSPQPSPPKSPQQPSPSKSPSPSNLTLVQLKLKAKKLGCKGYSNMKKDQLVSFVKTCKKSPVKSPPRSPHVQSPSPSNLTLVQLKLKAKKLGCKGYSNMNKAQLVSFVRTCKKSPPRSPQPSPPKSPQQPSPPKSPSPSKLTLVQLKLKVKNLGYMGYSKMNKSQLLDLLKSLKNYKK